MYTLLFHDGVLYHIETGPLICFANQWTGFYMIETAAMKELKGINFCRYKSSPIEKYGNLSIYN